MRHRVVPEFVTVVALALLGTVVWPFAPDVLAVHWDPSGFDTFVTSWVPLVAVPWSCVAIAAYLTTFPQYRQRPRVTQFGRLTLVVSLAVISVVLASVAF